MQFTVAIDGPAAAGKGTIAREVAKAFGFSHLDTGLLYRATGALVLGGMEPEAAARALSPEVLARGDLRSEATGRAASKVAAIPEVRAALLDYQRDFARTEGGAVLDGRDIGTVVCPGAEVKLYVTATDEVRAERRWKEEVAGGAEVTLGEVLADIRARDARDSGRETAPLKPAEDAVLLDTSSLGIDEAVARALAVVRAALPG